MQSTETRYCYKCKISSEDDKLYSTFGKYICKNCLNKRKTGRKGHSGMIYDASVDPSDFYCPDIKDSELEMVRVKKSNKLFVKWYREHYPKSKGIVGRQLNYLIYSFGQPIGIITFSSPPQRYNKFIEFFGTSDEKSFLNNSVFRIVHSQKNFGTRILKMCRYRIPKEYREQYKSDLLGFVTFVEPPRTGSLYKADNWQYIGETEGVEVRRRGDDWLNKQYIKGVKKLIFGYKFKKRQVD